jgi:hypothetical protein
MLFKIAKLIVLPTIGMGFGVKIYGAAKFDQHVQEINAAVEKINQDKK